MYACIQFHSKALCEANGCTWKLLDCLDPEIILTEGVNITTKVKEMAEKTSNDLVLGLSLFFGLLLLLLLLLCCCCGCCRQSRRPFDIDDFPMPDEDEENHDSYRPGGSDDPPASLSLPDTTVDVEATEESAPPNPPPPPPPPAQAIFQPIPFNRSLLTRLFSSKSYPRSPLQLNRPIPLTPSQSVSPVPNYPIPNAPTVPIHPLPALSIHPPPILPIPPPSAHPQPPQKPLPIPSSPYHPPHPQTQLPTPSSLPSPSTSSLSIPSAPSTHILPNPPQLSPAHYGLFARLFPSKYTEEDNSMTMSPKLPAPLKSPSLVRKAQLKLSAATPKLPTPSVLQPIEEGDEDNAGNSSSIMVQCTTPAQSEIFMPSKEDFSLEPDNFGPSCSTPRMDPVPLAGDLSVIKKNASKQSSTAVPTVGGNEEKEEKKKEEQAATPRSSRTGFFRSCKAAMMGKKYPK